MPMTGQAAHKEMIWDGDTLIYRLQVSPDGWFYVNDQPTGKATDVNGGWPTAPEHFGMQMADLVPGWARVPVGPAEAEFVQMPKGGIRLNFRIRTSPGGDCPWETAAALYRDFGLAVIELQRRVRLRDR